MNELLRKLMGPYLDPAKDGSEGDAGAGDAGAGGKDGAGDDGAGGDTTGADKGAGEGVDKGAGEAADAGKDEKGEKKAGPTSMLEAITEGLKSPEEKEAAKKAKTEADAKAAAEAAGKKDIDPATGKPRVKLDKDGKPIKAKVDAKAEAYKMPEGIGDEAKKRFVSLVNDNKKLTAELTGQKETLTGFRQVFEEAQMSSDEFAEYVNFHTLYRSGNFTEALKILDGFRTELAKAAGVKTDGFNPLDQFPDLKEQVDKHQITEAAALELAQRRTAEKNRETGADAAGKADKAKKDESDRREKVRKDSIAAVDTFMVEMRDTDIDFAAKEPLITEEVLEGLVADFPPHLWAKQIKFIYDNLRPEKKETIRPLRIGGLGGGSPVPKTMYEAMWGGKK